MDNAVYKLTDIMTVVKANGKIAAPNRIDPRESADKQQINGKNQYFKILRHPIVDISIEGQIMRDFIEEDLSLLQNASHEVLVNRIKRYQRVVKETKKRRGFICQICAKKVFLKDNGENYCEAHHIVPLSLDGSQDALNIIILCANHHRMFHYAKKQIQIESLINGKRIITINQKPYIVFFN